MKKVKKVLIVFLLLCFLSACTKDYSRSDIKNYVKEELNLTNISVSKTYEEIKDTEGYTDRLWTVVDKKNNITFHVLDDYGWGMESVANNLWNDYDNSVFLKYYSDLTIKDNIELEENNDSGLNYIKLNCTFKNKDELADCYESLISYKNYYLEKGFDLSISYNVNYDFSLKKIGNHEITEGDSWGFMNNLNDEVYAKMLIRYFSCGLSYQIDSVISEMNESDLETVMDFEDNHRIFKTEDDFTVYYYEGIIANINSYGISFGTLFKLLEQENYNPVGNPWNYTVTNKNGDKYEFSYDFNDELFDDGNLGYYYIKNNEKIKMSYYFYNCFRTKEINEMFDLSINEKANKFL